MSLIQSPAIRANSGFTYIGLLIVVAIMGVTLAMIGTFWSTNQKRAKEQQLIFIGNQFSNALYAYYENPPGGATKQYPKRLEDLLQDHRHLFTVRYLRKIFADPMTGKFEWGLIKGADGGIVGVRSLSDAVPLKKYGFGKGNEQLNAKIRYSDWQFISRAGGFTLPGVNANATLAMNTKPNPANPVLSTLPPSTVTPSALTLTPATPPPAATIPPAYQVPPPQPQPPDPSADQRKLFMCQNMRVTDANTCALLAVKFGDTNGMICMASANDRYSVCTSEQITALPALVVTYQ
jgi:type II secretory pathway pseudopilin PulG